MSIANFSSHSSSRCKYSERCFVNISSSKSLNSLIVFWPLLLDNTTYTANGSTTNLLMGLIIDNDVFNCFALRFMVCECICRAQGVLSMLYFSAWIVTIVYVECHFTREDRNYPGVQTGKWFKFIVKRTEEYRCWQVLQPEFSKLIYLILRHSFSGIPYNACDCSPRTIGQVSLHHKI